MDEMSEGRAVRSTLRIAVAVAVLRTKPADLTSSEYCEQLRLKAIATALRWHRQRKILSEETIRLKEEIVARRTASEDSPASESIGSHPAAEPDGSVFPTPPSSLDATSSLDRGRPSVAVVVAAAAAGGSFYETVLDACMTCSSSRAAPIPVVSDALLVLLDTLKILADPAETLGGTPALGLAGHRSILEDVVIGTLLRLDNRLPSVTAIDLKDFFYRWIARFVLDGDGTSRKTVAPRPTHAVAVLRRLTSGQFLLRSITEAVASHLTQLTVDQLTTVRPRPMMDVCVWERVAILLLLMERLLEVTSGQHDDQWQRMLGHCLGHLRPHFPLLVHRICALTCRLGRL